MRRRNDETSPIVIQGETFPELPLVVRGSSHVLDFLPRATVIVIDTHVPPLTEPVRCADGEAVLVPGERHRITKKVTGAAVNLSDGDPLRSTCVPVVDADVSRVYITPVVVKDGADDEAITVGGKCDGPTRIILRSFAVYVHTFLDPRFVGVRSRVHSNTPRVQPVRVIVQDRADR